MQERSLANMHGNGSHAHRVWHYAAGGLLGAALVGTVYRLDGDDSPRRPELPQEVRDNCITATTTAAPGQPYRSSRGGIAGQGTSQITVI